MKKILTVVLSVMLLLGVFITAFGIESDPDFFVAFNNVLDPFVSIGEQGLKFVDHMFDDPMFLETDEILVFRFYFDDGHYCDVGRYRSWFAKEKFLYSSNSAVDRLGYPMFLFLKQPRRIFYDDNGDEIYKQGITQTLYHLRTTFGDYVRYYRDNSSKEGWTVY